MPSDNDAASAVKLDDVATLTGLNADENGSFRASMRNSARLAARRAARATLLDRARRRAAQSQTPLYLYLYDHIEPGAESARWGAFHAAEIPYVFGTFKAAPQRPYSTVDRQVGRRMAGYRVNFVKAGTPNGPGLPHWAAFNAAAPAVMEIGDRYASQR